MGEQCCVEGCINQAQYVIEWYGLNQFGKNPVVADERPVCGDFTHMVHASFHDQFGGVPDGVVDAETLDKEHPELVARIIAEMEKIRHS